MEVRIDDIIINDRLLPDVNVPSKAEAKGKGRGWGWAAPATREPPGWEAAGARRASGCRRRR